MHESREMSSCTGKVLQDLHGGFTHALSFALFYLGKWGRCSSPSTPKEDICVSKGFMSRKCLD